MTDELKPCPFCGGTELETFANTIGCECGAHGPAQEGPEIMCDRRQAAQDWNRRAALSGTREAVEPVAWVDEFTLEHLARRNAMATTLFSEGGTSMVPLYRAAPPSDPVGQGAVTVKPLEWEVRGEHYRFSQAYWGTYIVEMRTGDGWTWGCHWLGSSAYGLHKCASENEAKAAAQADFERRILSALSPAPEAGSDEVGRLRFEGDLDKWMKILGAGISGYQPEAYAVMDAACHELTALRDQLGKMREALGRAMIARDLYEAVQIAGSALAETQEAGR